MSPSIFRLGLTSPFRLQALIGISPEALFGELAEAEHEVFYDRNEQHRILAEDVEEYLGPVYSSDAQLVVCILGPEYPKRVWAKFESDKFKDSRFKSGEVIPAVLNTAPLGVFDSASKVGHVAWDRGVDFETQLQATTKLLIRKSVEVRAQKKLEAERARAEERSNS